MPDVDQPRLGTNWVLTEKVKEDETVVKARLTTMGDLEDTYGTKKD